MRKLILSMMVSLDGLTARSDGDLNWFLTDEEFEAEMLGLLRSVDAILLGRVSYQLLGDYWPSAGTPASSPAPGGFTSDDRERAFAELMNIDEYRLMVHPIVLGKGIPLFKDPGKERRLSLSRTKTFPSGVVLLQYDRRP